MKNSNLHAAKVAKNDEFYTRFEDINFEINLVEHGYRPFFKDKIVYCNCDDPEESNFWKFFKARFNGLKLKKLISTHYDQEGKSSYKLEYDGERVAKTELDGNGDFRSPECVKLLKESDIVVTNPPFSLFREFVALLMKYEKKFVIIGNKNAITYKEIFPLIKDNKIWLGYTSPNEFIIPGGEITKQVTGLCRWFTNLEIPKRHEPMLLGGSYERGSKKGMFPKYDNYDAINVDRVCDIPEDYEGVMGVPITFLDKYCPEQFEIVAFRKGEDGKDLVFTREREREFNRTFVSLFDFDSGDDQKRRRKDKWENYLRTHNDSKEVEPVDVIYPLSTNLKNGMINNCTINGKKTYCRMLIRRKTTTK